MGFWVGTKLPHFALDLAPMSWQKKDHTSDILYVADDIYWADNLVESALTDTPFS
jgi:hypothetical protein